MTLMTLQCQNLSSPHIHRQGTGGGGGGGGGGGQEPSD